MTIHFSRFGQVKSQGARKSQARAEDLYFYACSRAEDEMTRKPSGRSILGHREFQYTKASPSYTRANSAKIEPEPQYGADGSLSYFYESLEFRPLDSFFVPFHISYYMTKELFFLLEIEESMTTIIIKARLQNDLFQIPKIVRRGNSGGGEYKG